MTILPLQLREVFILSIILLILLSVMLFSTSYATTYRWVDEGGKVYYSQSIPPSAAQNGHTEMNAKSGRVLNDISSRDEREKERQRALVLKAKAKEKQLRMREELSLELFSSRAEVEKHFERRLEMVSVNLRLLQYHRRKLMKDIVKIQQSVSDVKTRKERRTLSKRLQKLQSTLLEHTQAIDNNQKEQLLTNNNRQRALDKYDQRANDEIDDDSLAGIERGNTPLDCACVCDKNNKVAKNKAQAR